MQTKTLDQLKATLDELNKSYPRHNLTTLAFCEPIDIKDVTQSWPNANHAGVYALFDENMGLLYIGKASCNTTLGYRLGKHFDRFGKPRHVAEFEAVRYAATVPFPDDRSFEAPSVEEFLIARLNPPLCKIARTE